jgi:hypothetical protein
MGKGKAHGRGVAKRLLGPHRQQTERSFAQGRRSNLPTVDGGFCPDPDLVQRERFCYEDYNFLGCGLGIAMPHTTGAVLDTIYIGRAMSGNRHCVAVAI